VTDVPLTPYEQRALATIEDRLGTDDPDLASALRRGPSGVGAAPDTWCTK
jgi:hypothetical protein